MHARSHILAIGVALLVMTMLGGCTGKHNTTPDTRGNPLKPNEAGAGASGQNVVQRGLQKQVNQSIMYNIGQMYNVYKTDHDFQPPRTVREFKDYLERSHSRNEALALEKDWIVLVLNPPPEGHQLLAYEKESDEKWHHRLVVFADGAVETLDDATFRKLVPNP